MNLLQIRTKLRRMINDESSQEWTDAELNSEINLAYSKVQKEIFKIDREAHLFWDTMAATSGTSWYPLPQTFGVSEVGIKGAASDTVFTRLNKKSYEDIKALTTTSQAYCIRGQWLGIFPAPSTTVADGIEFVHFPVMTLSDDTA